LDHACISKRYSIGKTLVYRNLEYPNPSDGNINKTDKIYCHATLPLALWLQNYYTFFHFNNLGAFNTEVFFIKKYNSVGVKKKIGNYLHPYLRAIHYTPLFILTIVIHQFLEKKNYVVLIPFLAPLLGTYSIGLLFLS
jgi:hypothetical protein